LEGTRPDTHPLRALQPKQSISNSKNIHLAGQTQKKNGEDRKRSWQHLQNSQRSSCDAPSSVMIDRMSRSYIILSSCFKCRLVCQLHCLTIREAISVSHIYVRFEALSTADTRTNQSLPTLLIYSVRKTVLELGIFRSINSTKSLLLLSLNVLFNDSANCSCYIASAIDE